MKCSERHTSHGCIAYFLVLSWKTSLLSNSSQAHMLVWVTRNFNPQKCWAFYWQFGIMEVKMKWQKNCKTILWNTAKLVVRECHRTPLMILENWFGAVRRQAITWVNIDPGLCHHMVSLNSNELNSHIFIYKLLLCMAKHQPIQNRKLKLGTVWDLF